MSGERTALVLGATGQDGSLLTERLLADGVTVHAASRRPDALRHLVAPAPAGLHVYRVDLEDPATVSAVIALTRPDEIYNLAGESSVSASFDHPLLTWQTNAHAVAHILESLLRDSPESRFFQASSSEMFGFVPGSEVRHDESSALEPQSPYAAAKAAAHVLCHAYRNTFGLRIACGIVFNHESARRPGRFLSRKVTDHVRRLREAGAGAQPVLPVGNLKVRRDWGYAPDFVEGIVRVLRQVEVRAAVTGADPEPDEGPSYRDYVLGTGRLHAVWELVDRAFALGGFPLSWSLEGKDPARWGAVFRDTGRPAVAVDRSLIRPTDPPAIQANPSRAHAELGWAPGEGLDPFLQEMLAADPFPLERTAG